MSPSRLKKGKSRLKSKIKQGQIEPRSRKMSSSRLKKGDQLRAVIRLENTNQLSFLRRLGCRCRQYLKKCASNKERKERTYLGSSSPLKGHQCLFFWFSSPSSNPCYIPCVWRPVLFVVVPYTGWFPVPSLSHCPSSCVTVLAVVPVLASSLNASSPVNRYK